MKIEKTKEGRKMYNNSRKNNGITLVALVVTVIILLILAGISIATLTGNGLFEKAKLAKEKQANAEIKEEETLGNYENKIGEYVESSVRANSNEYDILWSWETVDSEGNVQQNITNSGSIVLNNNIENYKYLVVFSKGYQGTYIGWGCQTSTIVPAKITQSNAEIANSYYQYTNAGYNIIYGFLKSNTLDIYSSGCNWYTNYSITEVWGMK